MPETHCGDRGSAPPLAFVIDDDDAICRLIVMMLAKLGIETMSFRTAKPAIAAAAERQPQIIFLDIALAGSDAVHLIEGLSGTKYSGVIQLMTGGNPMLVKAVERIGARHGMSFLPALQKPFRRDAILEAIAGLGLATPARPARRVTSGAG
jgi:FixJ family two-component response regulator